MRYENKLIVLCGIPASGKTTYAHNTKESEDNIVVVSRDKIRLGMLSENSGYFDKEKQVYKRYVYEISEYLSQGKTVIADATQATVKSRKKLFNSLKNIDKELFDNIEKVAVNFNADVNNCIKRNEKREGLHKVPNKVIFNFSNIYVPASLSEGFDRIYTAETDKYNNSKIVSDDGKVIAEIDNFILIK